MPRLSAPRSVAVTAASALLLLSLAACTSNPVSAPDPSATAGTGTGSGAAAGPNTLPSCEKVTPALGDLIGPLTFDPDASELQTAPEAYQQRVCVYTSPDTTSQLSVTIADIPFQQTEIDGYATLPNAIADDRLSQYDGVIQTLDPNDPADGLLDSPLYLFDTLHSVTIYPVSVDAPISTILPGLTIPAAIDAAFSVRALLD